MAEGVRQGLWDGTGPEPITLLLTQPWFGAETDVIPRMRGLRGLFVQYPGQNVEPALAQYCDRWDCLRSGETTNLGAALAYLFGGEVRTTRQTLVKREEYRPRVDFEKLRALSINRYQRDLLELRRFEFEVVTVNPRGEIIQRQNKASNYFVEMLSAEVGLEMVEIPSGSFVIGSPENEAKRIRWESPQHQVSVERFLMGKYPVTQAQWSIVANWEKIEARPKSKTFCIYRGKVAGRKGSVA